MFWAVPNPLWCSQILGNLRFRNLFSPFACDEFANSLSFFFIMTAESASHSISFFFEKERVLQVLKALGIQFRILEIMNISLNLWCPRLFSLCSALSCHHQKWSWMSIVSLLWLEDHQELAFQENLHSKIFDCGIPQRSLMMILSNESRKTNAGAALLLDAAWRA